LPDWPGLNLLIGYCLSDVSRRIQWSSGLAAKESNGNVGQLKSTIDRISSFMPNQLLAVPPCDLCFIGAEDESGASLPLARPASVRTLLTVLLAYVQLPSALRRLTKHTVAKPPERTLRGFFTLWNENVSFGLGWVDMLDRQFGWLSDA